MEGTEKLASPLRLESTCECTHCGLPVPGVLVEPHEVDQFCCLGCRTAYAILHECGLDAFYDLSDKRLAAVSPSGRSSPLARAGP